ncbi:MAG TPA: hypothetical protein VNA30_04530 [Mycobacteriales bacterium]|nr:hypothetical protein [Mycobacteriales bacterium]
MDTLHDRLAQLADDAPKGGAPAAELWARGTHAHRLRSAALAATLLVVLGTVGAGIGLRLANGDDHPSSVASTDALGITLPITYPDGEDPEELPALGAKPGPLAAVWVTPRVLGGELEAVGLVAKTGTFGVLQIDAYYGMYEAGEVGIALSPDGRKIAYTTREGGLTVRDLVSGEKHVPAFQGFEPREGWTWIGARLFGHVAAGSDVDGWVWEPGSAPKRVDLRDDPGSPYLGSAAGIEPWFLLKEFGSGPCSRPTVHANGRAVLCDEVGTIGPEIVLTRWDGEIVALYRADSPFQDPKTRRPVVVAAGAPGRVAFATGLIRVALDADRGAS